jgi:hypothetical protein
MTKTRRHRRNLRKTQKNIVSKSLKKGYKAVETTSKNVMPQVKTGLENIGSNVIKGTEQSVPYLQQLANKFFGYFS